MKHLSRSEFVDHAEGRLSGARASHVEGCRVCADRADHLRRAIAAAADADVPEPSPLFWQRFPERVHEAIRGQAPAALSWWRHPAFTIACTAILVVTVFAAIRSVRMRLTAVPSVAASAAPAARIDTPLPDESALDFLADIAAGVQMDDQTGVLAVRPAAIDRAVVDLSPAEREEFRRLLQNDLKRTGA